MILALAGEEPGGVMATGGGDERAANITTTHLAFASGLRAHIFASSLHPFKVHQLVVVGERKMAVFDDTRPWPDKLLLYANDTGRSDSIPLPGEAEPGRLPVTRAEPLELACRHFLHCVRSGCRPVTDGREGLRVLKVLDACRLSRERDGMRVDPGRDCGQDDIRPRACSLYDMPTSRPVAELYVPRSDEAADTSLFIHQTAIIDENCEIGAGTSILHFSHVLSNCRIGEKCNIGQNVVIGPDVSIGSHCRVQNNVSVYKGVTLEDGVCCGPSMVFASIGNPRAGMDDTGRVRPTFVKKGAILGANCTVVCGVAIGQYSFVGAGAVVTRDVPNHAVVVGCPARQTGWACVCGERLVDLECPACGKKFIPCASGIEEEQADLRPVAYSGRAAENHCDPVKN
jgi:UDP-2-acetamido-3-amino-2,3-dideoxy-glucuronate N-acetyltransferase